MRKSRKMGLLAAVAGLTVAALPAQASAACWQDHEVSAAKVRNLQSMLMVAALQCSGPNFRTSEHYDNFVRQNRSTLVGHNDALKSYFMRAHGIRDGQRAYDAFTTALANSHSDYAMATGASFCHTADSLVRLAATSTGEDLLILASNVSERPFGVGDYCSESAPVLAGLAPLPPRAPALPAPAEATEPAAEAEATVALATPLPAVAVAPADAPVAAVAEETEAEAPTEVAAAVPAGADAEQAATAQALQAAAVALQAAAEALKSATAQPDDAVEAITIDEGKGDTQ